MALLHDIKPFSQISKKATAKALRLALEIIFAKMGEGVWLVGGTALAGFYAEHRRSDDLDLFALNAEAFQVAVRAVQSLKKCGASFHNERRSPLYFHADVEFEKYKFTIDVVLDENLATFGQAHKVDKNISVVSLDTLLEMKISTLISRASAKDLYDLNWLFKNYHEPKVEELVAYGKKIDGGISVESLLISLSGSILREDACHFLLKDSSLKPKDVLAIIATLRKKLITQLRDYEKNLPPDPDIKGIKTSLKIMKKL